MELVEGHARVAPPDDVPVWDIDPYDPAILASPQEYYAQLRKFGPFVYLERYAMLACGNYAEVREVFSDWERFPSSRGVGLTDFSLEPPWRPPSIVLEVDPPYHSKTRAVLQRALSPRALNDMKTMMQEQARILVDQLLQLGEFDAIAEMAETFPTTVFPKAVGLQQPDRRKLVDYGSMVFNALGPDNAIRQTAMASAADIVPWITEQCQRENLSADGFGASIYDAADSGEISPEEAGMLVRSLLSAGIDTTVSALGNAMYCLASHADQFDLIRESPQLVRPAFEEVLRLTSPVHSFCRTAGADTKVSGIRIEANTKILCVLASANLDDKQWPDPTRFDVNRKTIGHLALGAGIHMCVGQNVARAEAQALLTELASRVASIEITGTPVARPNNAMQSLASLPVRITPA